MGFGVRRGEFRFLILMALNEYPMHGYALIQQIGRTYQRPVSAGLVYPLLQELEDRGYVSSAENQGKRVYSINDEGKKHLWENKEIVERLRAGKEYAGKIGQFGFLSDLRDIQALVMLNDEGINEWKMERIHEILAEAKKKTALVVFDEGLSEKSQNVPQESGSCN